MRVLLLAFLALASAEKQCVGDWAMGMQDMCTMYTQLSMCQAKLSMCSDSMQVAMVEFRGKSMMFSGKYDDLVAESEEMFTMAPDMFTVTKPMGEAKFMVKDDKSMMKALALAKAMGEVLTLEAVIPGLKKTYLCDDIQAYKKQVEIYYFGGVVSFSGFDFTGVPEVKGLDYFGCMRNDGCDDDHFYCEDNGGTHMKFGVDPDQAMRAQLSDRTIQGGNCRNLFNTYHTQEDANAMCKQLGYARGTVVAQGGNTCAEVHYDEEEGVWTTDGEASDDWGSDFECFGEDYVEPKNPVINCEDIQIYKKQVYIDYFSGVVSVSGFDFTNVDTVVGLAYFGCMRNDGCDDDHFYCRGDGTYMEFGVDPDQAMRATLTDSTIVGGSCRNLFNTYHTQEDANAMCKQLGYNRGTVVAQGGNSCAEVHWDGSTWTTDGVASPDWGSDFGCYM